MVNVINGKYIGFALICGTMMVVTHSPQGIGWFVVFCIIF